MKSAEEIGRAVAARVFKERSRGKTRRNVEIHIGEKELAELLARTLLVFAPMLAMPKKEGQP